MPERFHIPDHLVFPFGTAQKFALARIKLSSVAGNGIYFTSDIPCVYIERTKKKPLRPWDYGDIFGRVRPPKERSYRCDAGGATIGPAAGNGYEEDNSGARHCLPLIEVKVRDLHVAVKPSWQSVVIAVVAALPGAVVLLILAR